MSRGRRLKTSIRKDIQDFLSALEDHGCFRPPSRCFYAKFGCRNAVLAVIVPVLKWDDMLMNRTPRARAIAIAKTRSAATAAAFRFAMIAAGATACLAWLAFRSI